MQVGIDVGREGISPTISIFLHLTIKDLARDACLFLMTSKYRIAYADKL